jgi:hypothetical protein
MDSATATIRTLVVLTLPRPILQQLATTLDALLAPWVHAYPYLGESQRCVGGLPPHAFVLVAPRSRSAVRNIASGGISRPTWRHEQRSLVICWTMILINHAWR